jgi:hypothetical protein
LRHLTWWRSQDLWPLLGTWSFLSDLWKLRVVRSVFHLPSWSLQGRKSPFCWKPLASPALGTRAVPTTLVIHQLTMHQDDKKAKKYVGYIVSSRPALATKQTLSRTNKKIETQSHDSQADELCSATWVVFNA